MNFFTGLADDLVALGGQIGGARVMADVSELVRGLSNDDLVQVLQGLSAHKRQVEAVETIIAGVIAARSTREAGKNGLAQQFGFANPAKFVQHATGVSRGEAFKRVRVGESLFETGPMVPIEATGVSGEASTSGDGVDDDASATPDIEGNPGVEDGTDAGASPGIEGADGQMVRLEAWHQPLNDAFLTGCISTAQQHAIRNGLGEPLRQEDPAVFAAVCAAWREAAIGLISEAERVTVEELGKQAHMIRDELDPEGAEARYWSRYEKRSFRMWTDADGFAHASMLLADMDAAWVRGVVDAAMRPRRGGVRFRTPEEVAKAEQLQQDARSNEQLEYDLIMDVLRAGTLAQAEEVHGARQAGVRVVTIVDRDEDGGEPAGGDTADGAPHPGPDVPHPDAANPAFQGRAHFEETGAQIPAWEAARETCTSGIVAVTTDRQGNPLDVGREQRLYTPKQRIGISLRDRGCMWPECDRPPSYCEAHHIDEWAGGGRTDIDRGISLCRFHHMTLHNAGWRITRGADLGASATSGPGSTSGRAASNPPAPPGDFILHPPPRSATRGARSAPDARPSVDSTAREPVALRRKLAARYQWGELCPPAKRFRPGAAASPMAGARKATMTTAA